MVKKRLFGKANGEEIYVYTMTGENVEVTVTEYGAGIQSIKVNGREITLGFDSAEEYYAKPTYFGATVGRVANRISNARFTLNGNTYFLDKNNGENSLHSGFKGYNRRIFKSGEQDGKVVFTYISAEGDQGYPGTLNLKVEYVLNGNTLRVNYTAASDKDTLWAPTNHTFFNLSGEDKPVYETELKIYADKFTPVNKGLIPTGELKSVKGTAFDFTGFKRIGADICADEEQLSLVGGGYDHNFVLNGNRAVTARYGGVQMDVYTDMRGLQLYTANSLNGVKCRNGIYGKHSAFCLEPQFFPNAINTDGFEKPVLKAGENKTHYIEYRFTV